MAYEHWFTEKWLVNFTYSEVLVGHTAHQPGDSCAGAKYLGAILSYIPVRNVSVGLDDLSGQRKNLNGQRGDANRLALMAQYHF